VGDVVTSADADQASAAVLSMNKKGRPLRDNECRDQRKSSIKSFDPGFATSSKGLSFAGIVASILAAAFAASRAPQ
jgi:hypothetical protein